MLRLHEIRKNYVTATETVEALRGVSLAFRRSEFVSVLGPSGCGKTTLLNLIGGLDRYTAGDLYIGGRSTADFTDRDWDVYRNHRVGFIFQSYNLIPHQTILQNVELALTIAGVSREERIARAKKTLDRVGLAGMYAKRPNQLSGGQCQRVAIARALVNDPEILLADEPTGALDTVTSKQIMDLIREIAGERLVIMVTHNPELAEEYSTRIVRLLDGQVVEDTAPLSPEDEIAECRAIAEEEARKRDAALAEAATTEAGGKKKPQAPRERAKMSLLTAFRLSARNLFSKRRRTALVGFAGSIGIIGIAMVLALSAGIRGYIFSMQDDMLSGNPIRITEKTYDLAALTDMMSVEEKVEIVKKPNHVYVNSLIEYLAKTAEAMEDLMVKNDLSPAYTDYVLSMPEEYRAAITVDYGLDLSHSIYTPFTRTDNSEETLSVTALTAIYTAMIEETKFGQFASYATALGTLMAEAPANSDYIASQYDIVGEIADEADEVMLVLSEDTELTDLTLAKLGYYTEKEFLNLLYRAIGAEEKYQESLRKPAFTYNELFEKELIFYPNDAIYTDKTATYLPPMLDPANQIPDEGLIYDYSGEAPKGALPEGAIVLKVVGILEPKEDIMFGCLTSGLYYTRALANHAREVNRSSAIVAALGESDALTSGEAKIGEMPLPLGASFTYSYKSPADGTKKESRAYVGSSIFATMDFSSMMGGGQSDEQSGGGQSDVFGFTDPYSLLSLTRAALGGAEKPTSFTIYPTDFDNKDRVVEWLDGWNGEGEITLSSGEVLAADDRAHVTYTDTLSLIIALIDSMITVVSTALIVFTSISLVVSTVMIGILTYVSVVERTKEIGVIRSLGGRKRDVSHLFNAETFIIGFLSGLIGVLVTALLSLVVNLLIKTLAGVSVTAYLPIPAALILIGISVGLTLISGLIPSRAAAKMDPVNALRSE